MKRSVQISLIILIVGSIGLISYKLLMNWHNKKVESARAQIIEELRSGEHPATPEEKPVEPFREEPARIGTDDKQRSFEDIDRELIEFFFYLDSQEYIKAYKLKKGTYHQFLQVVNKLSSTPPVVIGETESLFSLFKNMSHLYRVLGRKRINLILDILRNESGRIESVSETIYLWFTKSNGFDNNTKGRPSLKSLYDYSGYFLNTLAGRSYLLRRETKIRILTTYYSILILDKANDAELNANGIDIRLPVKMLFTDIRNHTGLINKEIYLSELEKLNEKYL